MGATIDLQVDSERITPEAWRRVYEESWRVLRAYPDEPMTIRYHEVAGERILCYQRNLELAFLTGGRGWRVGGDMRSKLTGETFDFPEVFGRASPGEAVGDEDLLVLRAQGDAPCGYLFGNKACGRPYRVLILAVATLVENRFPRAALAGGDDFDLRDARRACELLEQALGERFELPVVLDKPRMRERLLPVLGPEATEEAVRRLSPLEMSPLLADICGILLESEGARFDREAESCVACTDAATLSAPLRLVFALRAAALRRLLPRLELDRRIGTLASIDRQAALRLIAIGTRENALRLTEDAWNAIEAETPEQLRFLVVVALPKIDGLELRQITRALFESAAIRRCAFAYFDADCDIANAPEFRSLSKVLAEAKTRLSRASRAHGRRER